MSQNGVSCKVFADDTKIYRKVSNSEGKNEVQEAIDKMVRWAEHWGLPLSYEKTVVLHLGKNNPKYSYCIGQSEIRIADSVRDLGFILRPDLSLKEHAQQIAQKANWKIFNLFKSLKIRDKAAWMKIYKTYLRPIIEFGPSILNNDPSISKILEAVQNSFSRKLYYRTLVTNYNEIPAAIERNRVLDLDTLKHRRDIADIKMISKILANDSKLNKNLFFSFNQSRTRGGSTKLSYPMAKTKLRKNCFSTRVGRLYIKITKNHSIPKSNKAISTLLKKFILENRGI